MTSLLMTFIHILIVAIWKSRQAFRAHGWGICHFKLLNYLYLTILWWERTQFSNSTFWRLVFSHSWFRIHLQLDFVSLEMNYEPLVWEHQSPKCFGGEPTILSHPWLRTVLERKCSFDTRVRTGMLQECSHIRVWEHPGEFWLVNQLYQPIRNVF